LLLRITTVDCIASVSEEITKYYDIGSHGVLAIILDE